MVTCSSITTWHRYVVKNQYVQCANFGSNILSSLSGFNLIVHQSLLMVPRFNHRSFRPNSGNNSSSLCTRTKPLTNHRRPVEDLQVRFRMLLANCLVPSILLIQRVNIRFLEASIDTHSTQRPSRSSQTIQVFQSLSLSLITALLIKDLHTMALLTCLIMGLLRRSRNIVMAWATIWLDRVRTTPCHPTMHLPTCLTVL